MTTLQRLNLRKSELSVEINDLQLISAPTEEQRSKLTTLRTEHREVQTKYQEALKNSPGPEQVEHRIEGGAQTTEQRAFVALEDAVHPADFLGEIQGQAAEYRAELGMSKGIPHISLLDPVERVELRADVVSTISNSPRVSQAAVLGKLLEDSISVFLGVSTPSVPAGSASFPTVSAAAAAGVVDKGVALESTAVTLSGNSLVPVRAQSRVSWQLEAEYSQPEFRSALQTELRRSLRETVDKLALAGKASAPAVEGFLATLTDPTNPGAVAEMKDLIDVFVPSPPWSSTPAEPRLACNRDVIKYFMSLSDSTQVVVWDRDVLSPSVADIGTRIRATSYIPVAASTIARSVRLAGPRGVGRAVLPIWEDGLLVEDLYTNSSAGLRHMTLVMMVNFKILDSAPYSIVEFKLA